MTDKHDVLAILHNIVAENRKYTTWTVSTPHLIMLWEKAQELEREECAKVIESHGTTLANGAMLADAIRARGQA